MNDVELELARNSPEMWRAVYDIMAQQEAVRQGGTVQIPKAERNIHRSMGTELMEPNFDFQMNYRGQQTQLRPGLQQPETPTQSLSVLQRLVQLLQNFNPRLPKGDEPLPSGVAEIRRLIGMLNATVPSERSPILGGKGLRFTPQSENIPLGERIWGRR